MREFTLETYRLLLEQLQAHGYELIRYEQYCRGYRPEKFVILRHDVDLKPANSLLTAQIEHAIGAQASYYFQLLNNTQRIVLNYSLCVLYTYLGNSHSPTSHTFSTSNINASSIL